MAERVECDMRLLGVTVCIVLLANCSLAVNGDEEKPVSAQKEASKQSSEYRPASTAADMDILPSSGDAERTSVTFEETVWGRPRERITIAYDGRVRHEIWDRPLVESVKKETSFELTTAQHQEAMNVLAPLRDREGSSIGCDNRPTDGPYGSLVWDGDDKLLIYMPCLSDPKFVRPERAIAEFRELITTIAQSDRPDA